MRVADAGFDLGRACGEPLLDASIVPARRDDEARDTGDVLWRIREEVPTPDGLAQVDQRLTRRPDGRLVVTSTSGHLLEVDTGARTLAVDGRDDGVRLQLLTTFGLPLLLHGQPALVLHAAAACRPGGGAVVICGESGRGKSSSLVGLVDAGWAAVSEDLCTIDLRGERALVWPGPPWVRRGHGLPGPNGAAARFTTPDKTAWDIASRQVDRPVPVDELVFLEAPGGAAPDSVAVSAPDAVAGLAHHAMWLREPGLRAAELFGPTVAVANAAPARRIRLPRSPDWLENLVELLG